MEPILNQEPQKEPTLNDVGTRYTHLSEHCDSLEFVRDRLLAKTNLTFVEKQWLVRLTIAAEVTRKTIDSFAGFNSSNLDYQLYRLLNTVPKNAKDLPSERGTPLC